MSSVKEQLAQNRRAGHQVPDALKETRGSASFATDVEVPKLTPGEKAKTLIWRQSDGVLSTIAHQDGFPYGSVINYAFDSQGELFFVASALAEHTANLSKDNRASLLVSEARTDGKQGDRLAMLRVTVVGSVEKVEKTTDIVECFKERHPQGHYVVFDDFYAFKFRPVNRSRVIVGFGEMATITGEQYNAAQPDPIAKNVQATARIIEHMNSDHADACVSLANAFAVPSLASKVSVSQLVSLDRLGMDFLVESADGKRLVRVPFTEPLSESGQVKDMVIKMTQEAAKL